MSTHTHVIHLGGRPLFSGKAPELEAAIARELERPSRTPRPFPHVGIGGPPSDPPPPPRQLAKLVAILCAIALLVGAVTAALVLTSCSSSAVRVQAVAANGVAVASNAALEVLAGPEAATSTASVYEEQQLEVARTACGNATPCADREAARDAVLVIRARWAPVWSAWALAGVAHAAWRAQLMRCQGVLGDAGADGGTCGPDLAQLQATAILKLTVVRCALRGLRVNDPFPGAVSCPGMTASPDAGSDDEQ